MPTVLRINGYEIFIYLHDHLPAHVHVFVRGGEVIINLDCLGGEPEIRNVYRASVREARKALDVVIEHRELLCNMWKDIHGEF
jgi:hypothetical protein